VPVWYSPLDRVKRATNYGARGWCRKCGARCVAIFRRRGFDDLESMLDHGDDATRLAVYQSLLHYGYGKPPVIPLPVWLADPAKGSPGRGATGRCAAGT
jgi:hypothetical protein